MHYLKVTALATALAALAATSPVPHRAVVEGAESLDPDTISNYRRDRAVVEGAESLDSDSDAYRKEKRDRAVVEGAEGLDSDSERYRKEKRGVYSKYENNGPYVPMSDETEV